MVTADPMARHYAALTAQERFSLVVEAMARRDDAEADRLEDACPHFTYRMEDDQFRGRMRRAFGIAVRASLDMRAGLAQVRLAGSFRELCHHFAAGPVRAAEAAFLLGRSYGRWEDGTAHDVDLPEGEALAAELAANPDLGPQLAEVRQVATEGVRQVAERLHRAVGRAHAEDLLSHWAGFDRFCRAALGLGGLTVIRAFGLGGNNPTREVAVAYPDARTNEAAAARFTAQWTRIWDGRFGRHG